MISLSYWNIYCVSSAPDLNAFKHEEMCFFRIFLSTEKCVEKLMRSRAYLNKLRMVGKLDETLFRVNDITSQTVNNSWRNSEQTFAKCYEN